MIEAYEAWPLESGSEPLGVFCSRVQISCILPKQRRLQVMLVEEADRWRIRVCKGKQFLQVPKSKDPDGTIARKLLKYIKRGDVERAKREKP